MTSEDWKKIQSRSIATGEPKEEPPIETELPEPPTETPLEEDNPFTSGSEETAITAAQDLTTCDPQKIKTVTQVKNPFAFAYLHTVAEWERQEGAAELAALDDMFGHNLEMFEESRRGKDNRARLMAEIYKALRQQEIDQEQSAGSKLMGR